MGQIVLDPIILMKFIYESGGWILEKQVEKRLKYFLYDGTSLGLFDTPLTELDEELFKVINNKFITEDSGNTHYQEYYYHYNPDFKQSEVAQVLTHLIQTISLFDLPEKYKNLIRQNKLERLV